MMRFRTQPEGRPYSGDFPVALRECILIHVMTSSVVDVVGEQQERGMSTSGQDIFLLSPSRFPRHNCAFVHTTQSNLDVRFLARNCYGGSKCSGCLRFGRSPVAVTFEYGFGIEIRVLQWGLG
ncbi:hypothetical protein EDB84DRAFT_1446118 [Lactarius hengduanensis]|nr:hypothetical protein EDB84DRAFT_1446118 [Lactarius hengduanensis]